MSFLLDTHCFLWALLEPHKLSDPARDILTSNKYQTYLSAASCWEIAIKFASGKLSLPALPDVYVPQQMEKYGIVSLPVTREHGLRVHHLPPIHKDPFDRLIIAQAQVESLTILSDDHVFTRYDIAVLW